MSLTLYKQKRKFTNTPEPEGREVRKKSNKLVFVIHKHQASHLHYDLRLEVGRVLKSWAVPKGPSLDPKIKRLAMMVEDHPYEYRHFEGSIPKGNYGAGDVIIWDQGYYKPRKESDDPNKEMIKDINKGMVSFILYGKKLRGEFTLVKEKSKAENAWLLIKKNDEFASGRDISKESESVVSGREIKTQKSKTVIDVSKQPEKEMPSSIKPMLAYLSDDAFDDSNYIFEVKWDGYRALLYKKGKDIKLKSRNDKSFNTKFSEIVEAAKGIEGDFVIDGEVVALDQKGKAHFEWLQNWGHTHEGTIVYIVFDILWLNGHDLRTMELKDRKEVLNSLIAGNVIKYSDHIEKKGKELFGLAIKNNLEGIMAKRSGSTYQPGRRSRDWLKLKTHMRQEAVIGGFTEPKGSRKYIGALVLGIYKEGKLFYAGHSGGGIPPKLMPELRRKLESIEIKKSPFIDSFKPNSVVHYVKPELICEVTFSEWTKGGHFRQPIFVGLREDKKAKEVRREKPITATYNKKMTKVELTHLDKVFWPKLGITKGDLINYYRSVSDYILPYLKDRPHSLLRQPNGINGQAFFQKDMDHTPPDWVKTVAIYSESNKKDINYLVCDSPDSLIYMVQLGCIEINPWSSTTKHLDKPDWAVIDLDPEEIGFESVIKTANTVKSVCDQLDIETYPKTSGKTGIHIYIPLGAKYTYDQSKQFSQLIAQEVNKRLPDITSIERSPTKRKGKVYIDYLQNRKGQTLAAPYCVRPAKNPNVSMPLDWSEIKHGLKPEGFNIKNAISRTEKIGDIWQPVLSSGIDMLSAINRMK